MAAGPTERRSGSVVLGSAGRFVLATRQATADRRCPSLPRAPTAIACPRRRRRHVLAGLSLKNERERPSSFVHDDGAAPSNTGSSRRRVVVVGFGSVFVVSAVSSLRFFQHQSRRRRRRLRKCKGQVGFRRVSHRTGRFLGQVEQRPYHFKNVMGKNDASRRSRLRIVVVLG